jgi:hypothetical protein
MRGLICLLVLSSTCYAQQVDFWGADVLEPVRTYANGLNVAKAEKRPLMIFVTQKNCPPCKIAWRVFDAMRQDGELGNCVLSEIDSSSIEAKALMVGKRLTPQLMVLDMRKADANGAVDKHVTERVDKPEIVKILEKLRKSN